MSIAILCPTRSERAAGVERLRASVGTNHIYTDDRDMMPTVQKWNDLAEFAKEYSNLKLFMLGSDDMYFETPGWDKALLDHYNALENKIHVYALRDSRDASGTPHPIVTREYIDAMGYFMPPIFLHWFIDTWTVEIAKANGVFTHMKDYLLVHDKPSDKGQGDETHNRIRQWGWHDRDKWVNEKCAHFLVQEKYRLSMAIDKTNGIYAGPAGSIPRSYSIENGLVRRS